MEGCSRDVEGEEDDSMKSFREGISLVINSWWPIRGIVHQGFYGPQPEVRLNRIYDRLFSRFIRSKDHLPSAKIALKAEITSLLLNDPPRDNSLQEVCDRLVAMYQECLQGDFSSIQIIKEANYRRLMWKQANNNFEMENDPFLEKMKQARLTAQDRLLEGIYHDARMAYFKKYKKKKKLKKPSLSQTRLLIRRQKMAASKFPIQKACPLMQKQVDSSEMDDSNLPNWIGVFKEGVVLLMKNLLERHVFVHKMCGSESNRSLMLQQLADYILFWFTQTIKSILTAPELKPNIHYIEWILRNKIYFLPVAVEAITNGITKGVAEKLMVMYEECLQGNFSSVEILREESLCSASELLKLV